MRFLKRFSLGLFVIVVIILAIVMGGMRLAISNIEYFKPEIDYLLSRDIGKGIVFTGLSGTMNRFNPVLSIQNVSINLPDRSQPLFVDQLDVEFDFWASLREQAPVVLEISGQLEKLELTKDASGRWWSHEFEIGAGVGETVLPGFARVLSLVPRYLKIDLRRLIVRDQKNGNTHQFDRLSARINHQDDQFYTQLSVALPGEIGRGLLLKSVIDPERSVIYINASNLQLPAIAGLFDVDTWGLKQGVFDGEFWVNMSAYRVVAVNGDMVLKRGLLQVSADKTPLAVNYHTRFNAINKTSGWRVTNDIDRLNIDGNNVLGFQSQLRIVPRDEQIQVSAWIERLQISSLPVVAGQWLPAGINRQIAQSQIQGLLRDVMLDIDLQRPRDFRLSSRVIGINSKAFASYPGVSDLNAELVSGNNKLALEVKGKQVSLDFGDQFRAPIELESVTLKAHAKRLESGLMVVSVDDIEAHNEDIELSGRVWLRADPSERPFMYLRANFRDANGASNGKYIPLKLMPQKTIDWLDRGIKEGHVPRGDLLFHGRLRDVRKHAEARSGELFVDFEVERGDVFFAPDWLNARNGNGRVLFHNVGVEFDLDSVSYEQIDKVRASGRIASFDEAVLELDIETKMPTSDAVRVWIDTPVGERFRRPVSFLHDFGGEVNAAIDVNIPLGKTKQELGVRVNLDFENAALQAQSWGLDLSKINGRFQVTEDEMMARQVDARFFGDPVKVDINSESPDGDILVNVHGLLESSNLLRRLPADSMRHLSGKSDWRVRLKIAADSAPADQPYLQINAASNLVDTGILLPLPVGKPAEDSTRVSANLYFFPNQINFNGTLGTQLQTRGRLLASNDLDFQLEAMDLAFATPLRANTRPGLHLYGNLPELSLAPWLEVIKDSGATNPSMLSTMELDLDRVNAFGREVKAVKLELRQVNQQFLGLIESSIVEGSFEIPRQASAQNPAIFNLAYLRLDKLEHEVDYSELRPGDLPDFRLSSQQLVYQDMMFSDFMIEGSPVDDTLYIDKLSMRRDKVYLAGKAQWKYDAADESHLSSISTTIQGAEFGEAIAGIGFGDSMRKGSIDFEGGFTWPAPLFAFKLDNLAGNARLKIEDGVLNNVEPGSGRFVGLLSLSALPRRLSLDFSDVLIKGMEFDKISGTYRIENGVIFTKDTRMDGPAAKIKIKGKTGILERNYDQHIRVTPKIRQTLPLVGAVLEGATVGWGLLLLQNLFKRSIDDAVEVEYLVKGSWDDPQIELIKAVDENKKELPTIDK
ncbi:MAG: TIGR02099 family protein [Gammaproteobacteria bacterium]|nr:TIGR02099 family protein [Gammaproteobacteria bacterium]